MSDAQEDLNKELIRGWAEELFNQGRLETAEKYLAAEFVNHNAFPGQDPGPGGVRDLVATFRKGFPDLHGTLNHVLSEGDMVSTHLTMRGTHDGDFMGIPPSGRKISANGMGLYRIENNKIIESWVMFDSADLIQQITGTGAPSEQQVRVTERGSTGSD